MFDRDQEVRILEIKGTGLELMEALRVLISRDDSSIAWAKRKDALCFMRFVVDRIPTPVLGGCSKTIR